jgi:3-oxoadipate enol-lactonase
MRTTPSRHSIEVRGTRFAYDAYGDPTQPTLILTHSLLWDRDMFDPLIPTLAARYRVLAVDLHGHGESSDAPAGESLTLEQMTDDCAALLQTLAVDGPVHWAGLSMGGMIGMRLAVRQPGLVHSLVLMDTSAKPEDPARRAHYMQLAEVLRRGGAASVADAVLPFYFCPTTFAEQPALIARYRDKLAHLRSPSGIFHTALAVFGRDDFSDELSGIAVPTLVLVGADDISTPPDRAEHLAAHIRGARLCVVPAAGHMSATEKPAAVAAATLDFLTRLDAA